MSRSDGAGLRPETLTVGLGYDPASARGSAKPPIYMTSTFVYETAQHAKDVHRRFFDGPAEGEAEDPAFIYARLGNPNLTMVETRLAALDRAEAAAGFCSGMAAISTVLMAHVRPGDSILHGLPVYSGADGLMNGVLARFGVNAFHFTDGLDAAALAAAMEAAAAAGPLRLIWLESPANPTGAMIDLALAARLAGEIGARQGQELFKEMKKRAWEVKDTGVMAITADELDTAQKQYGYHDRGIATNPITKNQRVDYHKNTVQKRQSGDNNTNIRPHPQRKR